MTAHIMCPHCSRRYEVDEKWVGKNATCKACGRKFVVENLSGPHRSPGGVPIYRPEPGPQSGKLVHSATPYLEQIARHIERTIGPAARWCFMRWFRRMRDIDLHIVPAQPHVEASDQRPLGGDYVTVVTSGMSSKPMKLPPEAKKNGVSEYAELMLALPKDWPGLRPDGTFDQREMKDEAKWWPFSWLKRMATPAARIRNVFCSRCHRPKWRSRPAVYQGIGTLLLDGVSAAAVSELRRNC